MNCVILTKPVVSGILLHRLVSGLILEKMSGREKIPLSLKLPTAGRTESWVIRNFQRIKGLAQPRYNHDSFGFLWIDAPLVKSGLMGPVRIIAAKKVKLDI